MLRLRKQRYVLSFLGCGRDRRLQEKSWSGRQFKRFYRVRGQRALAGNAMVGPPSIHCAFVRNGNGWCALEDSSSVEYSSGAGCLTRLYWMFFGNALLALLLVWLLVNHPRVPSFADVGYLLTLVSVVVARYIDIRHLKGETGAGGALATLADWRKFSVSLVSGCVVAWVAVRVFLSLFIESK